MKKSILGLFLIAVALLATGCSKKNTSAGDAVSSQFKGIKPQKDSHNKVYDFKGLDVILADYWSGDDAEAGEPVSKMDADTRAWHKWTQATYNFTLKQKQLGAWDAHPQEVNNFCVTGGDENYVFIVDTRSIITGMKGELFYDVSKFKDIDWSKDKWNKGVLELIKRGDSFYAFSTAKPEPRQGVFFNKRLLEEAGIDPDLPYDLQKEGKWNWEAFEDMLKKCTRDLDNDGIPDTYGMANSSTEFTPTACVSNGLAMIGRDENGKFVNNCGDDRILETIDWVAHLQQNYEMPQPEGSNWDWVYAAFQNGQVAFQVDQEYNAQPNQRYSSMKDDYGYVAFPLGPKGDGKYRTLNQDNMYVIPSIYDDERAAKIMKAFDLWSDPTPGYDGEEVWKEGYYSHFRDERAVDETLTILMENPCPNYSTLIPGINYMGDMIWSTYGGWVTPQEAYESCKNNWQALLDDANNW